MNKSPHFTAPGISKTPPLVLPAAQLPGGIQCALQVWAADSTQEDEFSLQDVSLVAFKVLQKCPTTGGAATLGTKRLCHLLVYYPPQSFELSC